MERWVTGTGVELRVHSYGTCRGSWCVIHKPMPGPWDSWPTDWRDDRRMVRVCPCGVGHPVAEEVHWTPWAMGNHGCCGCPCRPDDAKIIDGEVVENAKELPWQHD